MHIKYLKKVGRSQKHQAFTDLCQFQDTLACCYREATNHVSKDGEICIRLLSYQGHILKTSRLSQLGVDLRDPKLSITPDGQLMLIAYARHTDQHNKTLKAENWYWLSGDGHTWSKAHIFAENSWWLWRLRWNNDQAYGFAYNRGKNAINLFKGDPRMHFTLHQAEALSLEKHDKGYPNESDILFHNNTMYALVRRDADTYSAQLGVSKPPYKVWKWQDLGFYLGGPVMLKSQSNTVWLAGRVEEGEEFRTALLLMDLDNLEVTKRLLLPSAGDNSYPGLVLHQQSIYMSYYSSHKGNSTSVYFAKIDIKEAN